MLWVQKLVSGGKFDRCFVGGGEAREFVCAVADAKRHQMGDALGTALYAALDFKQPTAHDLAPELFKEPRPEHDIHDARFIFDGDEDGIAFTGALPDENYPGDADALTITCGVGVFAGDDAFMCEQISKATHGVAFEGEARCLVICSDML